MHIMRDLACGISVLPLVAVAATGMPSPHFYSSSFASSLWNATRCDQHSYRLREPRPKPIPQPQEQAASSPVSSPTSTDSMESTTTETTLYTSAACPPNALSCSASLATSRMPHYSSSPQSSFTSSDAEVYPQYMQTPSSAQGNENSTAVLTDYLSRLEQRLTHIEEQNQRILSTSSPKSFKLKPLWSAATEGLRLLIVTAFPVIVWGTILGLSMVVLMHVLGFLFDLAHPFIDKVLHKTSIAVMIVSRFVVEFFFMDERKRTGSSSPGSDSVEPKF